MQPPNAPLMDERLSPTDRLRAVDAIPRLVTCSTSWHGQAARVGEYKMKARPLVEGAHFREFGGSAPVLGHKVVLKRFCRASQSERVRAIQNEVAAHRLVSGHPNILGFVDFVQTTRGDLFLVTQAAHDDVLSAWRASETQRFSFATAHSLTRQVALAVAHMHTKGVAHRNIQPANLLLSDSSATSVLVSDFGHAVHCGGEDDDEGEGEGESEGDTVRVSCPAGNLPCPPPELLCRNGDYDAKAVDVWCVGVAFHFMATGRLPVVGGCLQDQSPVALLPKPAQDFLRFVLEPNPAQRPPISDVLQHECMRNLPR